MMTMPKENDDDEVPPSPPKKSPSKGSRTRTHQKRKLRAVNRRSTSRRAPVTRKADGSGKANTSMSSHTALKQSVSRTALSSDTAYIPATKRMAGLPQRYLIKLQNFQFRKKESSVHSDSG